MKNYLSVRSKSLCLAAIKTVSTMVGAMKENPDTVFDKESLVSDLRCLAAAALAAAEELENSKN